MENEYNPFIPYEQGVAMKELGFDPSIYTPAILWHEAFTWFRKKYGFNYSIGNTNIAVIHYLGTTQLLQNNESYEAAELAAIKWFIDVAKQL
jgi:hypothetical protein